MVTMHLRKGLVRRRGNNVKNILLFGLKWELVRLEMKSKSKLFMPMALPMIL